MARTAISHRAGDIKNGSFDNVPSFVAETTTQDRWVDGTAAGNTTNNNFGVYYNPDGAGASGRFISTGGRDNGAYFRATKTTGGAWSNFAIAPSSMDKIIPVSSNTEYKYSAWVKNVGGEFYILYTEYDATGGSLGNTQQAYGSTTSWGYYQRIWTTNASAAFLQIQIIRNLDGLLNEEYHIDDILFQKTARTSASARTAADARSAA